MAGCTSLPAGSTSSSSTTTSSTTTSTSPATTTTTAACGGEFSDQGELLAFHAVGDARRISSLHTTRNGVCEQFVIGFTTESGAPATSVSDVDVQFLRDLGVIRINLPGIAHTSIADGVFESPLVDRAYVVKGQDGNLYVDAHLSAPSLARAEIVQSPARVVIELEAGGEDLPLPATTSDLVVLMTPRERKGTYPLLVSGYARVFEANVVVRIVKAGSVEAQQTATATDYLEAWGEFAVTFDEGPQGALDLLVGEGGNDDLSLNLVLN